MGFKTTRQWALATASERVQNNAQGMTWLLEVHCAAEQRHGDCKQRQWQVRAQASALLHGRVARSGSTTGQQRRRLKL